MRWMVLASLLCGCGALDVPPRGPLARHDLLFTSVNGDDVGDITGFDSLVLLHPDGNLEPVVEGQPGSRIRDATWSPDGESIAYTASTTDTLAGPQRYHVAGVVPGGTPRVLARVQGSDVWRPRWSPDGRRLVASITVPDGPGSDRTHTRVLLLDATGGNARLLSPPFSDAVDPEWSADGRHVYYVTTQRTEVWRVAPDGGEPELLLDDAGIASLAVSPRGDALLVSNGFTTYLVDPETGRKIETIDAGWGLQYLYSPDGSQLAFVRNVSDENLLFTYGAWGLLEGEPRHLHDCDGPGSPGCPTSRVEGQFSWSPDSRWLALGSAGRIYVVRAADGYEIAAPSGNRVDSNPQWRPER